jgi:hypothetical protein
MTGVSSRKRTLTVAIGMVLSAHGLLGMAADTDGDGIDDASDPHPGYGNQCAPAARNVILGYLDQYELLECHAVETLTTVGEITIHPGAIVTFSAERTVLRPGFRAEANSQLTIRPYDRSRDTDGDGMSDYWEYIYGLDPVDGYDLAAVADADKDGLEAVEEAAIGTNPFRHDSDGDGFNDGDEHADGSNPLDRNDNPLMPYTYAIAGDFSVLNAGQYPGGVQEGAGHLFADAFSVLNQGLYPGGTSATDGHLFADAFSILNQGAYPGGTSETAGELFGEEFSVHNSALFSDMDYTYAAAPPFSLENTIATAARQMDVQYEIMDSDGDGISDAIEIAASLDPWDSTDALLDLDEDGLSNLLESQLGTQLGYGDSDEDGRSDGQEMQIDGTDPLDPEDHLRFVRLDQANAALALDTQGGIHALWSEQDANSRLVYAPVDHDGLPQKAARTLQLASPLVEGPYLLLDGNDAPWALWTQSGETASQLLLAPMGDPNSAEITPLLIEEGAQISGIRTRFDANGNLYIAWRQNDGLMLTTLDASEQWAQTLYPLNADATTAPALAVDDQGATHLIWNDANGGNPEIRYARLQNLQWSDTLAIASAPLADAQPQLHLGDEDIELAYQDAKGLRWQRLDRDDLSQTMAQALAQGAANTLIDPTVAWTGQGYTLTWSQTDADGNSQILLQHLDADRKPGHAPETLGQGQQARSHQALPALLIQWQDASGTSFALFRPDDDHDGLSNAQERLLGTDKTDPDSDGDGLSDAEEADGYPLNPDY